MNDLSVGQCVAEDDMRVTLNLDNRITILVDDRLGSQVTSLQVVSRQEVEHHLERRIHILYQVCASDCIAVGHTQRVNTRDTL